MGYKANCATCSPRSFLLFAGSGLSFSWETSNSSTAVPSQESSWSVYPSFLQLHFDTPFIYLIDDGYVRTFLGKWVQRHLLLKSWKTNSVLKVDIALIL